MDKIAVLIPCYNEALTIYKVVTDFKEALPESIIYVYDNNSTDATAEEAVRAGAVVRTEKAQGKGNVLRRMFREINAECYVLVDGDDTYPAKHASKMCQKVLQDKVDMVVGDRLSSSYFTENKRLFHNFGNSMVCKSIQWLFACDIQDVMTGYRCMSYNFVKTFPVLSRGFEIETEMTIHAYDKCMLVDHVIVDYRDRPEGSVSKLNTISDGIRVLCTILNLYRCYRPFSFFGFLSLILVLMSTVLICPVLLDYFQTGLVERFPTLIGCGFMILLSSISFFSGLILSNIRKKDAQDFEFKLQIMENIKKSEKVTKKIENAR